MLKRNKLKIREIFALLFSLLAILIAISAVAISNYRIAYKSLDYDSNSFYGWVVAVFGVFITILIGWNIYNAIGIERDVKELRKELNNTKVKFSKDLSDVKSSVELGLQKQSLVIKSSESFALACIYFVQAFTIQNSNSRFLTAYFYYVKSLQCYCSCDGQKKIARMIDASLKNMAYCIQSLDEKRQIDKDDIQDMDRNDEFLKLCHAVLNTKNNLFSEKRKKELYTLESRRRNITWNIKNRVKKD